MVAVDWSKYPATLRISHIADIYNRRVGGVRRAVRERSKKLPTPCEERPYGFNKADVIRHYERRVA